MPRTWPTLALAVALGCATPGAPSQAPAAAAPSRAPGTQGDLPATATPPVAEPAPGSASVAGRVVLGMDAAAVRLALGEPLRIDRVASSAARGSSYERWSYAGREVVLLDGKVIDVVP